MKRQIVKFLERLGIKSARTKNISKHVLLSFFYKGGSILSSFLLVPLTINYLDTENYGIWLTLSSFIAWFSFFDIGLGNGLRNKFTEARANGDNYLAQAYVSSAYYTIGCVCLGLFIIFYGISSFIDWSHVFNTSKSLSNDLSNLMPIVFGFFCLQLISKLITTIYLADQHHSVQIKVQFFTQSLSLLIIWLLTKTSESSLFIFGTIFSALPATILFGLNIFAFSGNYKNIKPKISLWKKKYLTDIMGVGFNFFIIQIAALVLFSTDNFIISKLFSPQEVVPYNVAFKYFSIMTMVYTILVTPFWSAFTDAFTKKDYAWIKKSVNNIQRIWLLIPLSLTIMILFADWFYNLWVGDKVSISMNLNLSMALFVLLTTFNMIYSFFLNGVGKLRIQLYTASFSILINIPLSIVLARYYGLGLSGIILATCFSTGYSTILKVIQYNKLINNRATGLWAK